MMSGCIMLQAKKMAAFCSRGILYAYNKIQKLKDDTKAMGTIEVVLIVAILVALALLFKGFIEEYADGIFSKIKDKTDNAFTNW